MGSSQCEQNKMGPQVELLDKELWKKFYNVTNEMIVTKAGRRMFPVVKLKVSGLNPKGFYQLRLEFVQQGGNRWKYMSGGWQAGGKAESQGCQSVYIHPDSPNTGEFWMKREGVQFAKVKLTNKPNAAPEQVVLNSLHKYRPVVQIVQLSSACEPCHIHKFDFHDADFIAVTAYQNEEVTNLKIKHNPFAKAFQDTRKRPLDMYPGAYNNQNHLNSLAQLNSNLSIANNTNGNTLLGSSSSNGSLVISSSNHQNINPANYLDRSVKLSPNALINSTGSADSPNSNNSTAGLLNPASLSNNYANAYTAHGYLSAAAVACSRTTPTPFSMNSYYAQNQNATYQELTNSLGNLSNTLASTYNNLQQSDTMTASNSPHSYNNLILNTTTNTTVANNQSTTNYSLVNTQSLALTGEQLTNNTNHNSLNGNANFLIKTSNSPVATDLSPNANLSSSSSSTSSSLSSSSYCERYTPLRNHRSIPYSNIKSPVSQVSHPTTYYYNSWTPPSSDLSNWTITPEGCYPSVN